MTAGSRESRVLQEIRGGSSRAVYLVTGEVVLAEPVGARIAAALAEEAGGEVTTFRRPADLRRILADLRTYSLFGGGKVSLVVESTVLSDRSGAAYLIDQAADALPLRGGDVLSTNERLAAGRLLQVLRLFGLTASSESQQLLGQLPRWVFEGGADPSSRSSRKRRKRGARQVETLVEGLVQLLDAAHEEGLEGWAEIDASDLASVQADGLPDGHFLVLCEASAAKDHPVVVRLEEEGGVIELASVQVDRRGNWAGVEELAAELARDTGTEIEGDALRELTRRTLRKQPGWGPASQSAQADSTARFAAEYRKLSSLVSEGRIRIALVGEVVQDRGHEDLWGVLDAVGAGRPDEALQKLRRAIEGAEDPMAVRLGFFSLLAQFCRHMSMVSGMMELTEVPAGERNYNRFKTRYAAKLLEPVPGSEIQPLGKLNPFRLHKAYLAASRFSKAELCKLPSRVLDTELRLKGESSDPDAALAALVSRLAGSRSGA